MCLCGAGAREPSLSGTTVLPCNGKEQIPQPWISPARSALTLSIHQPSLPASSPSRQRSQPGSPQRAMLPLFRARDPWRDPSSQITVFSFASYYSSCCDGICSCITMRDSLPHPKSAVPPTPIPPPQILSHSHPRSVPSHATNPPPHLPATAPLGLPGSRDQQFTCWPSRWPLCWAGGSGSRQKAPWPRSPWD